MKRFLGVCFLLLPMLLAGASGAFAQGITTSSVTGLVADPNGTPLTGVVVTAVHVPSGTTYRATTRADGRYLIPGMRVGGPYRLSAQYLGFESAEHQDIFVNLGAATDVDFAMRTTAVQLEGITVTGEQGAIISSERTGAATSVSRQNIETLPTISRQIEDFARLTPQYSGSGFGFSFAGMDNRFNNITVDGSYFNNSFGLSGQPGGRTNVAPISIDALEQIYINIAPYDVRQGNFVGAGVNTVTRSGTNRFRGSLYHHRRDQGLVGKDAGPLRVDPGEFKESKFGGWLAGPVIQNRLFFFVSYEDDALTEPGTTFRANTGGQTVEGNTTRVLASDLDALSNFLRSNFNYETGPYQGYDHETPARRGLAKLDFNVNDRNKLSLRYVHLDSNTDVMLSNSGSLGEGNRRFTTLGLNFQNSNYQIMENIRSLVGEWNAMIGTDMSNNLIIGYTSQDESRNSRGTLFPMVDIREGDNVYTTFGFEPFTPNNELRYKTFQLQNNFTMQRAQHALTFGVSVERYESENVFFPGSQSAYVYNSLQDFYTDANDYLLNPNRITSPVTLNRFQVRWSNIAGQDKPIQPLEVVYAGIYAQDEWRVNDRLRLTAGLRIDRPSFAETGIRNPQIAGLTFRDENGAPVQYSTEKMPDANIHFSPRFGFNLDPRGDRNTQVRGGTGIFTGKPPFVWISNQIGENGMLTGFENIQNTNLRPFHPDPNHYKPAPPSTPIPATSTGLAFTDPGFRFPQLWRSNLAVDQRLPFGVIATGEALYSRDINGIYYINANLPAAQSAFTGVDNRPRWTGVGCGGAVPVSPCVNRLNNEPGNQVTNAIVMKNQSEGYYWNLAASLEKPFDSGLFVKGAYSYGVSKNTIDPGSIASGSWNGNAHAGDPNNPGLGFSATSPGHRIFTALSYRREYLRFGATTVSLIWEGRTIGNASYTFANDLNGDGATNDLIYIPANASEMNFEQYTQPAGGGRPARTFTVQEQEQAWEAFIRQDPYLSKNRGRYAERNAVFLPMVYRADMSIVQEVFNNFAGHRNGLQIRADILNVGNILKSDWGLSKRMITTQPLTNATADAGGAVRYRLRNINHELISESFTQTASLADVYRLQLGLRYTFN